MLTIKRHVPKRLSLIHLGLSTKSYVMETVRSLKRRFARYRSRHDYLGRKSIMSAGALVMGFFGSLYVLFALQPQANINVATPATAKPISNQGKSQTSPVPASSGADTAANANESAVGAASETANTGGATAPSQAPMYAQSGATSAPSLVTSPSTSGGAAPVAPTPVASSPTAEPGRGSSTPSSPTTEPIVSPTPVPDPLPMITDPTLTEPTGPITTIQQKVIQQSTEQVVSPVTNTVDNLIN